MNNYYDLDIEKRPNETAEIMRCLLDEIGIMERAFKKMLKKVCQAAEEPDDMCLNDVDQ